MDGNCRAPVRRLLLVGLLLFAGAGAASAQIPDFTALVEKYGETVVSVRAQPGPGAQQDLLDQIPVPEDSPLYDHFRRFFEEMPEAIPQPESLGSGFIVSPDGYVLSNSHVIRGAEQVTVVLQDGRELPAQVVGVDRRTDIVLLKVEATGLPVATIGSSHDLRVGQWVLAIGSPFGLDYTATQGIISALGRSLPDEAYVPYIQTDAAINPGNSGGPLFNLEGEVVGINAMIFSQTGGFMGVSFAIPIDVAMQVAEQLRTAGRVTRGWLGVVVQDLTHDLARSFGLERPGGALVGELVEGGPADAGGLEVGDVIVRFEGEPIESSGDLPPRVAREEPGARVAMTVIRDHNPVELRVQLGELPEEPETAQPPQQPPPQPQPEEHAGLDIDVVPLPMEEGVGVMVNEVGHGPAAQAGLRPGDVILRLNNQPVTGVQEFRRRIDALPVDRPVSLYIRRDDRNLFIAFKLQVQGPMYMDHEAVR